MNLCKDCKHVKYGRGNWAWCNAIIDYTDPVTGKVNHPWCLEDEYNSKAARKGGACGPEGKLFEPAPPKPETPPKPAVAETSGDLSPNWKLFILAFAALGAGILATLLVR